MPQYVHGAPPIALAGQVAHNTPIAQVDTWTNPLLVQISEIAVGGTTDGDYTVRITGEEGSFDSTFTASSNTADQIADGIAAAIAANVDLLNIVATAAGTPGTPAIVTFLHPGFAYTITFPSNPGGNMTVTTTQTAGGVNVAPGLGLARLTDAQARIVTTGDTDDDFVGIVCRNEWVQINDGDPLTTEAVRPGQTMAVLTRGDIWVPVEDAVTKLGDVFVRLTATGTEVAGQFRSDADGGDAIQVLGARFETSTTAAGLAVVRLNRP